MRGNAGRSRVGCLFSVLLLTVIVYYGIGIGQHFIKYYRFEDAMRSQARFAVNRDNITMMRQLRTTATELDLPQEASDELRIRRTRRPREIVISTEWTVILELPFYSYTHRFRPEVSAPI